MACRRLICVSVILIISICVMGSSNSDINPLTGAGKYVETVPGIISKVELADSWLLPHTFFYMSQRGSWLVCYSAPDNVYSNNIDLMDISNPAKMKVIARWTAPDDVWFAVTNGKIILVATSTDLLTLMPDGNGGLQTVGHGTFAFKKDKQARKNTGWMGGKSYGNSVCVWNNNTLYIFDISDAENPYLASSSVKSELKQWYLWKDCPYYVTTNYYLNKIDVSDPEHPETTTMSFANANWDMLQADDYCLDGDTLYGVNYDPSGSVLNYEAYSIIEGKSLFHGSMHVNGFVDYGEKSIFAYNGILYVKGSEYTTAIIDLTVPGLPYLSGYLHSGLRLECDSGAFLGVGGQNDGLLFMYLQDPDTEVPNLAGSQVSLSGIRDVKVEGPFCYLLGYSSLTILEQSDEHELVWKGFVQEPALEKSFFQLDVSEKTAICSQEDGASLIDIHDPEHPVFVRKILLGDVHTYTRKILHNKGGFFLQLYNSGGWGDYLWYIPDIVDEETEGTLVMSGFNHDSKFGVFRDYLLMNDNMDNLDILDIQDPTSPVALEHLSDVHVYYDFHFLQDFSYQPGGRVDLTVPSEARFQRMPVGNTPFESYGQKPEIALAETYLFTTTSWESYSGMNYAFELSSILPETYKDKIGAVQLASDHSIAGLLNGNVAIWGKKNGVLVFSIEPEKKLYDIPHISTGETWGTSLLVDNVDDVPHHATIQLYDGSAVTDGPDLDFPAHSSTEVPFSQGVAGRIVTGSSQLKFREQFLNLKDKGIVEFQLNNESSSKSNILLLPQYANNILTWHGIALENPGNNPVSAIIRAYSSDGFNLSSYTVEIPPLNRVVGYLDEFAPGVSSDNIARLVVNSDDPLTGITISGEQNEKLLFTPSVPVRGYALAAGDIIIPHIATEWDQWENIVVLDNVGSDQIIELKLFSNGVAVVDDLITVGPHCSTTIRLNQYKDLDPQVGTLHTIQSGGAVIVARQAFINKSEGGFAEFVLSGHGSQRLLFPLGNHTADALDWEGIAVCNMSSQENRVHLVAYDTDGNMYRYMFTLSPDTRKAFLIHDIFPDLDSVPAEIVAVGDDELSGITISGFQHERLLFCNAVPLEGNPREAAQ